MKVVINRIILNRGSHQTSITPTHFQSMKPVRVHTSDGLLYKVKTIVFLQVFYKEVGHHGIQVQLRFPTKYAVILVRIIE